MKKNRSIVIVVIACLCLGCASMPVESKWEIAAGLSIAGDAVTTRYATQHGEYEVNPLLGDRPSAIAIISFSISQYLIAKYMLRNRDTHDQTTSWRVIAILKSLVTGWNLHVIESER